MQKKIACFISLLFVLSSFSQEKTIEEVIDNTITSDLLENVHLHLNKTIFSKGEHLWFTAYIQDQISQLPSHTTTNLYVAIYDQSGKEVKRKMLRVENGIASGDFAIDSSFVADKYVVLAWTNYMKNFEKLPPFKQHIDIIDGVATAPNDMKNDDRILLEGYPEGGKLIPNTYNYLGIRYIDPNESDTKKQKVKLLDEEGNIIKSDISINADGYGKFGFMVDSQNKYFLEASASNKKLAKIPLIQSAKSDLGLTIDNTGKNQVIARLVISEETLSEKKDSPFTLAIVQNNEIFIHGWQVNYEEIALSIDRETLSYGINTAILFDEQLNPVSRRMFFNQREREERRIDLQISQRMNATQDSVELLFETPENFKGSGNISISVLSDETLSYHPANSVASSFLVAPYVNSFSAFKDDSIDYDRYKNYALDVKLLVEGWGRYDWKARTSELREKEFKMESGIEIAGKILDADLQEEKQVYFLTDKSKEMAIKPLSKDKSFHGSMALYKNDSLGISVIGKNGMLRKPKLDLILNSEFKETQYSSDLENMFLDSDQTDWNGQSINYEDFIPLNLEEKIIALDEVVVSERALDNTIKINSAVIQGKVITDNEIKRYRTVRTYLQRLGFEVSVNNGQTRVTSTRLSPTTGEPYTFGLSVNGMPVSPGEILNMPLSSVQSIFYDKDFTDGGFFVAINLREGQYISPKNRNKFVKTLISSGYARPQEYYSPKYTDSESGTFKKYGAIFWKGNLSLNNKSPSTILVPTFNQKKLKVFIEGMNENGQLISVKREINLE